MDDNSECEAASSMTLRNRLSGIALFALGLFVIWEALSYDFGSASRMGPGFLPTVLGIVVAVTGVVLAVLNDDRDEPVTPVAWRIAVLIVGAVLAFAVLIDRAGLVPATAGLVFLSGMADEDLRWKTLFVIFLILLTSVYLVFGVLLKIPFVLIVGLG
jgi:hypothetical protein